MLTKKERMTLLARAYTAAQADGSVKRLEVQDGRIRNSMGLTKTELGDITLSFASDNSGNVRVDAQDESPKRPVKQRRKPSVRGSQKPKKPKKPRRSRSAGSSVSNG